MNFCTKTDFTRNQTNQLSMNSFKENVVMHFWKLVVLFKGKQEEGATLPFLQSTGVPAVPKSSADQDISLHRKAFFRQLVLAEN
jgi:hypothetical protein